MPNQRNSSRRRSRRRRGQYKEHRTGFAGKLLVMLAVVAAVVLGVAIFFRVRTVEVQGNSIYSQAQIIEVCGVEPGDNLLMVNKASVSGNIYARLPYVQSVSVGRILPDTIVIQVQESELAGLVTAEDGSTWYINTEGRVLGSTADGFTGQVVEIDGFAVASPAPGQTAVAAEEQAENLTAALKIIKEMEGTGLIDQVTSIDVSALYDISLWCGEQYQILLGGTEEMDYKITYLKAVLEKLDAYQTGVIDLTFDQERVAHFRPWAIE